MGAKGADGRAREVCGPGTCPGADRRADQRGCPSHAVAKPAGRGARRSTGGVLPNAELLAVGPVGSGALLVFADKRPDILVEVGYDVIKSLHHHGFDKFILLNGHRIVNVTWLQIVGERAKRELGVKVVIFDPAYMSKTFTGNMEWGEIGHAEEIEGSHMWYYYPEIVKMDLAVDNPHRHQTLYHVDPKYGGDTLCYIPSSPEEMAELARTSGGTSGAPSKASRDDGRAYHEHLVKRLVEVIKILQE